MGDNITKSIDIHYQNEKIGDLIERGGCEPGGESALDFYGDLFRDIGEHFKISTDRMGEKATWERLRAVYETLDATLIKEQRIINPDMKESLYVLRDYLTRFFLNLQKMENNGKSPAEAVRAALADHF